MNVTLPQAMQDEALAEGLARFNRRRASGSKHTNNRDQGEHTPAIEAEAIGAEMAAGIAALIPWVNSAVPDKDGDLGSGVQVRHTKLDYGKLLIQTDDADDHFFFLVTGRFPSYEVVGFIQGGEAKRVGVWGSPSKERYRPCFQVVQSQLHSIEEWRAPI